VDKLSGVGDSMFYNSAFAVQQSGDGRYCGARIGIKLFVNASKR